MQLRKNWKIWGLRCPGALPGWRCNSERIERDLTLLSLFTKSSIWCNSERIERKTLSRSMARTPASDATQKELKVHVRILFFYFLRTWMQLRKNWKVIPSETTTLSLISRCNSERIESTPTPAPTPTPRWRDATQKELKARMVLGVFIASAVAR